MSTEYQEVSKSLLNYTFGTAFVWGYVASWVLLIIYTAMGISVQLIYTVD